MKNKTKKLPEIVFASS